MRCIPKLGGWESTLFVLLIMTLFGFGILVPGFYAGLGGTLAMTEQFLPFGFVALGLTVVILTGGIDLSVGSIASLAAVLMAVMDKQLGLSVWFGTGVGIVTGAVLGWINGLMVTRLNIAPLIATLATNFIYGSVATALAGPAPPFGFGKAFASVGSGRVLAVVPVSLALFFVFAAAVGTLIHRTIFGRRIVMIGYNVDAARFAGTDVPATLRRAYVTSGVMAAIAGLVLASVYDAVRPEMGDILLLTTITMVVLGGVSIFGGEGTVLGVVLAAFILGFVRQGLLIAGFSSMVTTMLTGAILLISIALKNILSPRGGDLVGLLRAIFPLNSKEAEPWMDDMPGT